MFAAGRIAFRTGAETFGVSNVRALAIGRPRRAAGDRTVASAFACALPGDTCLTPSYVPPPTTTPAATTAATFAATPPKTIEEAPAPAPPVVAPTAARPPAPVAAEALCAPVQCAIVNGSGTRTSDFSARRCARWLWARLWQPAHPRRCARSAGVC